MYIIFYFYIMNEKTSSQVKKIIKTQFPEIESVSLYKDYGWRFCEIKTSSITEGRQKEINYQVHNIINANMNCYTFYSESFDREIPCIQVKVVRANTNYED